MLRYNSFGSYVKRTFDTKVYKVNIDAGFTCPNRDGTVAVGGCTYCNNESFKPGTCRPTLTVTQQVSNGITYLGSRYGAKKYLAYFQAYTNTHASVDKLRELYSEALAHPDVIGLAIGTRPDCIDEAKLDLLAEISKTHYVLVEYGVQSVYDKTLKFINRGHDYETFLNAVNATRARGINTGAHLIVGLPTENREETLAMADIISEADIGFLKIHQLQIIKDTQMGQDYEDSPFKIYDYSEYLTLLVDFVERLRPDIVLQRMFATAPDEILIAPKWGRTRQQIIRDIELEFEKRDAHQGSKAKTYTAIS
jgi:radical SAM protein (TIGR01212 family)